VGPAAAGYALSHSVNDAFTAVNRLLARGEEVYTLRTPLSINGRVYSAGTFYIVARPGTLAILSRLAAEKGLTFDPFQTEISSAALKRVRPARIALWDQYGGAITSGWARFVLEQFEFPYQVVYPQTLDAGNLIGKFDVLILPDGATFARANARTGPRINPDDIPAEYRDRVGAITAAKTFPQLKKFMEDGGQVITIGSSTQLAYALDLPMSNALVERTPTGGERALPGDKFYVPGSVLRVAVDSTADVAAGSKGHVDVFYDNSPVFTLTPDAHRSKVGEGSLERLEPTEDHPLDSTPHRGNMGPAKGGRMYPKFTTPKTLTAQEQRRLLRAVRAQGSRGDRAILSLALGTGLRLRELDTTDEELEPGEATLQADRRGRECLLDHRAWAEASTGGSVKKSGPASSWRRRFGHPPMTRCWSSAWSMRKWCDGTLTARNAVDVGCRRCDSLCYKGGQPPSQSRGHTRLRSTPTRSLSRS